MDESLVGIPSDQILRRIRGEYLEMPGLRLTRAQAQRLWGLGEQACAELLQSLTDDRFLYRRDDGTYARLTDGPVTLPPARMVKAGQAPASTLSPRAVASPRKS